jgi:putative ABC transport system permease protein
MNKKLVSFIVKKYLSFDKTNPFISITAILAFLGVSIGVMVLMITMAIMNGTIKEFESKLFTMNYPLTILPRSDGSVDSELLSRLENNFPDMKFSPFLRTQAMIQNGESMSGVVMFGVDAKKEAAINEIFASYTKDLEFSKYDMITGSEIANKLFLTDHQKTTLFFSKISPSALSIMPKLKRFRYIGEFSSGLHAYDNAYVYTTIEALQRVLNKRSGIYDGIHVYSDDPFGDIEKLKDYIPFMQAAIVGWWEQNGNFFAAMAMEKKALFIVLLLIVLVASLNIISSLLMTVMSRRKEIALLLSMGASKKDIRSIFLRLGFIIGMGGMFVGVLLGFFGIYLLGNFDIVSLPADVYGTSKLPVELAVADFLAIILGSIVIVVLSSAYPAKKASNINILDVLRNE